MEIQSSAYSLSYYLGYDVMIRALSGILDPEEDSHTLGIPFMNRKEPGSLTTLWNHHANPRLPTSKILLCKDIYTSLYLI